MGVPHETRTRLDANLVAVALTALGLASVTASALWAGPPPAPILDTNLQDYFQRGTQPLGAGGALPFDDILSASQCQSCHGNYGSSDPFLEYQPHRPWAASMKGQSARDPMLYAALTIANQDGANAGEFCIRCHAPTAYLAGRSVPADGRTSSSSSWVT